VLARNRRNGAPRSLASGQGHCRDARVGDDLFHLAARDHKRREDVLGETCLDEKLFDRERTPGDVACMFEYDDVARRKRRRNRAKDLPVWKIPRHDCEQHAERTEADVALGRAGRNDLVGQINGTVLRIVVAAEGTLLDFRLRLHDRLAHLAGREDREFLLALPKCARQGP
jgi:hypothetical protein